MQVRLRGLADPTRQAFRSQLRAAPSLYSGHHCEHTTSGRPRPVDEQDLDLRPPVPSAATDQQSP